MSGMLEKEIRSENDMLRDKIYALFNKSCKEYPSQNCEVWEQIYAIDATLDGLHFACEDLHKIINACGMSNATTKQPFIKLDPMRCRRVERNEDMSPDAKLKLIEQRDGDVIVNIQPSKNDNDYEGSPFGVSVEFCVSGGRSPNTLRALRELMLAMAKDNEERPL